MIISGAPLASCRGDVHNGAQWKRLIVFSKMKSPVFSKVLLESHNILFLATLSSLSSKFNHHHNHHLIISVLSSVSSRWQNAEVMCIALVQNGNKDCFPRNEKFEDLVDPDLSTDPRCAIDK